MAKKSYWLWVKLKGKKTAAGYGPYKTKADALTYWKQHWHGNRYVTHKITHEV